MGIFSSYQSRVEKNVDSLISMLELQYNTVSSVTFTYAGRFGNVISIKNRHDRISYLAYSKARELNGLVGQQTALIIARFEKPETVNDKAKAVGRRTLKSVSERALAAKKSLGKNSARWQAKR
jgi:ABC-type antimicrobial peptide transport system ATPase subunit